MLILRHLRRIQCSVMWRILWMRLSTYQQFLPQMFLMSSQRNALEAHQSWRIATILVHHPQWMLYRTVKLFLKRQAQWKVYLLLFAISCVSCFRSVQLLCLRFVLQSDSMSSMVHLYSYEKLADHHTKKTKSCSLHVEN